MIDSVLKSTSTDGEEGEEREKVQTLRQSLESELENRLQRLEKHCDVVAAH